jgi:plastocyanin
VRRSLPRLFLIAAAVAGLAAAVFVAPTLAGSVPVSSKTRSVSVRDDFFSPRSLTVSRGDRVVWRWRGDNPHNVSFRKVPRGASRRGSGTKTSGTFARTLRKRGTYRYVCTIHLPDMRGSVQVR